LVYYVKLVLLHSIFSDFCSLVFTPVCSQKMLFILNPQWLLRHCHLMPL
jgi:hypothetical protein